MELGDFLVIVPTGLHENLSYERRDSLDRARHIDGIPDGVRPTSFNRELKMLPTAEVGPSGGRRRALFAVFSAMMLLNLLTKSLVGAERPPAPTMVGLNLPFLP